VDNIRFVQQWRVTNYALLIYGVAFFLRVEPPLTTCGGKAALTVALTATWAFSFFVLWQLQNDIKKFRDRLSWIYSRSFNETERAALNMKEKSYWFDTAIVLGLSVVSLLGAGLTLLMVWYG